MAQTRVLTDFSLVIPKEVVESVGLRPGDEVEVTEHGGLIRITPVKPLTQPSATLSPQAGRGSK